jgi:mannonate dehydratase
MGHDWMPNSVWRTTPQPVRGGAVGTAFDASQLEGLSHQEQRKFAASWAAYIDDVFALAAEHEFTEDEMWANYDYFLKAALPEAEAAGVVLAVQPDDPPMPALGRIARPFSTVAGFKKAEALSNGSAAWKVLACLGTFAEMEGGAANAFEMVRHFGPAGKIAYVHFRVVKGAIPSFVETYLGDGSWDPFEMMQALHESGFDGFIMDDHVPHASGDTQYGHRSRAHALGYMQGLFNALGLPIV